MSEKKRRVIAKIKECVKKNISLKKEDKEGLIVGLAGGVFRIIHPGHIYFLQKAKDYCDVLVVVVARDELAEKKGLFPPQHERAKMLMALECVDVVVEGKKEENHLFNIINPDVVILGYDQNLPKSVLNIFNPNRTKIVQCPAYHPQFFKTSCIMKKIEDDRMDCAIKLIEVILPEGVNMIAGQSHFIKTVEDLFEILQESGVKAKYGIAFCEASGKRLIRWEANDDELGKEAIKIAEKIGAGHLFVILLKDAFPINVLNRIKQVSEVVSIFCATANPCRFVVAEYGEQRAVLGVMDGFMPLGVEQEEEKKERHAFLRKIGYKK
jgi:cytidyltransferase-like protein